MKIEKLIKKVFVFTFIVIISFFMVTTLFNDEKVSYVERRNLTTFPEFEIKNLFSKKYYDDLTKAFSDQLELREYLVKGYFLFQFQRYFGDVVEGENKQLYSASQTKVSDTYYNDLKDVTEEINEESKKIDAKFIFLSIPRKDAYMRNELPKTYNSSFDIYQNSVEVVKNNLLDDIIFIDALEVFKNSGIYNCYYSNDHHVTPRCAYELQKEINKNTETNNYVLEEMFEVKQTIVNGAYNRQLGQKVKSDKEDLYLISKQRINYIRYENDEISNEKVYGNGNNYEDAYMEGDKAYTRIETNNTGKNIMFVGSSYTNIQEALSVPNYKRVVSIDYRHNKSGNDISYYVEKYDIDYVVFIPAQSTNSFSISQIRLHLGK